MILSQDSDEDVQKAAEDFVRAYSPYEMPNALVTRFNQNNQVFHVVRKVYFAWHSQKDDKKALEATNLVVDMELAEEISGILGREIDQGHRLETEELLQLKETGFFDISRINPGATAFWKRPSEEDFLKWDETYASEYPRGEEKIIYQGPRYRSSYSTKMTAYTWRNGQKHLFKIKLGPEVCIRSIFLFESV
jgi:hypothetical protein